MLYRLIILTGERRGEQLTVSEEPMKIGRGADCDVRVNDPEMAQAHAEVTHKPGGPVICDLGSMNRILVNNREVRQTVLRHGDVVELGRTRFLVQAYVQAEVEAAAAEGRRRRRGLIGGLIAAALVAALFPLTCHRDRPAPATPAPAPSQTKPALPPKPEPAAPAAIPAPEVPSEPVAATGTAELVTREAQEQELKQAAQALAETEARAALIAIKEQIEDGDLTGAARSLDELLWLKPDFAPALELKARLLERRGHAEAAPKPETAPEAAPANRPDEGGNAPDTAVTPAAVPVPPAPASEPAVQPGPAQVPPEVAPTPILPAARIGIRGAEISKFPESDAFREMRLLTVRLTASPTNALPDTGAVKVSVIFYERDRGSGTVVPVPGRGPQGPLVVEGPWRQGEDKTVSASYTVPADEPADRPAQFHGYAVRVFHHDVLQDATAQPRDLTAADGR